MAKDKTEVAKDEPTLADVAKLKLYVRAVHPARHLEFAELLDGFVAQEQAALEAKFAEAAAKA